MNDPHPELVVWQEPGAISRRVLAPIGAAIQLDDARRLGLRTTTRAGPGVQRSPTGATSRRAGGSSRSIATALGGSRCRTASRSTNRGRCRTSTRCWPRARS